MSNWKNLIREIMKYAKNEDCIDYDSCRLGNFLLNIDGYSSSRSKLPWMSYYDWGYKATVASMSDIIVSGGEPKGILYSVGALNEENLKEIAKGVGDASIYLNSVVLKGDANKALDDPWIDVASIGEVHERHVKRKGAKEKDYLLQIGYVGYGALSEKALKNFNFDEKIIEKTKRPCLEVNAWKPISLYATSSSDNSDGWASTIYNIIDSSNVRIDLNSIEIDPELHDIVSDEDALKSGEDYSFAVTVDKNDIENFLDMCTSLKIKCFVVGHVKNGYGLYYKGKLIENEGWTW
ncbi:MAG: thiamine-phosphate kinase [Caldisphaera sp.]|jgi:thiamine-monophosphate kinase|nr:MAG: hypothetical protein C0201_02880 [Caldisphaera sp.]PMP87803.1 MAG: hypothetical protein C0172_04140 [Caldisphaera sp.]